MDEGGRKTDQEVAADLKRAANSSNDPSIPVRLVAEICDEASVRLYAAADERDRLATRVAKLEDRIRYESD